MVHYKKKQKQSNVLLHLYIHL